MHAQNLLTASQIRRGDRNLTVETARAQQRWVQDVWAVGRGNQNDALAVAEAIHFHQQLVQGLLTFIVSTASAGATLAANGINLIDEDDTRTIFLRLLKQVTHARCTNTDEHFHEVRARDGVERNARLTCNGAGKKGFTSTRRAIEQHAARNLRAKLVVARWVFQEVLDFLQLIHCFISARNILKGVGRHVLGQFLRLGTANAEHAAGAGLHTRDEPEQYCEQNQHRQQEGDHRHEDRILRDVGLVGLSTGVAH